jgi:uncharacterized protein with HEPN domain
MQRSLCAYLQDVLDAAKAIHKFSDQLTLAEFEEDELVRSGVERKFEIIGEALRQAARAFPGSVASVPDLKDAVGQRNHIVHAYFDMDAQMLWKTKQDDLDILVAEVERLKELHCK